MVLNDKSALKICIKIVLNKFKLYLLKENGNVIKINLISKKLRKFKSY